MTRGARSRECHLQHAVDELSWFPSRVSVWGGRHGAGRAAVSRAGGVRGACARRPRPLAPLVGMTLVGAWRVSGLLCFQATRSADPARGARAAHGAGLAAALHAALYMALLVSARDPRRPVTRAALSQRRALFPRVPPAARPRGPPAACLEAPAHARRGPPAALAWPRGVVTKLFKFWYQTVHEPRPVCVGHPSSAVCRCG